MRFVPVFQSLIDPNGWSAVLILVLILYAIEQVSTELDLQHDPAITVDRVSLFILTQSM